MPPSPAFEFANRVALITGAGQGMGEGIAWALARQGAFVGVNDIDAGRAERVAAAIGAAGLRAVAVTADVRQRSALAAAVEALAGAADAPVDTLVHNAGIPAEGFPVHRFAEMDPSLWNRWMDVNYTGLLNGVHAVLAGMLERGFGRIVFISSEAGRTGLGFGVSLYGASKAAGMQFCRHLALEVADRGVTVNTITLGRMAADGQEVRGPTMPVGRFGSAADVGAAVVYLASAEAAFVTGQTLGVNGGSVTS